MKADDTRTTSTGKGVMDTGLGRIPELEGQVVLGRDVSHGYDGDERADSDDHDTGIAALSPGTGTRPGSRGQIHPSASPKAMETPRLHQRITEAIRFAVDSKGGPGQSERPDAVVRTALHKGKLIFPAFGDWAQPAALLRSAYPGDPNRQVTMSSASPSSGRRKPAPASAPRVRTPRTEPDRHPQRPSPGSPRDGSLPAHCRSRNHKHRSTC